ncbi:hypothetical protein [Phyllobacterium sp. P30BS-XVII]|uniref:hypothetical protein n=1 Tax=Phyllobacterium sp. P30BS-XVII TaxID=2587046 RepID=UPI0015FDD664|nr:hypothetical protein [Phyllobacterium sp. P30BS-XVII]MBA8901885.1 hypothetical protein [Phyllobacterium sp. P30BS-XVII]
MIRDLDNAALLDANGREVCSNALTKFDQIHTMKRFTGPIDPLQIQYLLQGIMTAS